MDPQLCMLPRAEDIGSRPTERCDGEDARKERPVPAGNKEIAKATREKACERERDGPDGRGTSLWRGVKKISLNSENKPTWI